MPIGIPHPRIIRSENDILFAEDGQRYIDMFSANGTTWLGHANKNIVTRVAEQLERVWITGGLGTAIYDEAKAMVETFFPSTHRLGGLYSTGMEAAEFAIRIARVVTKRNGVVGFEKSMHGKSMATAYLGWDNKDRLHLPSFYRLPFVPSCSEEEILRQLKQALASNSVSAVFVEPLQGSGGGWMASKHFYQEVYYLCQESHALLVFDEILTGFYRTGEAFVFTELGFTPDIILVGKAMGNGFPVSGVVVNRKYAIQKKMLPGSTFAENPLASAAVAATLQQMRALNLFKRVAELEDTIIDCFSCLREIGFTLRGKGALWIIELSAEMTIEEIAINIYRRGVFVSYVGHLIRILPAATIEISNLEKACYVIRDELFRAQNAQ
jgi:acetylornithine/succinyldiaminopimelate/putrescine aminotransferase